MGITGLLPFLEQSSKRTNINQFSGKTVAIDSYCWLHKGVFPCADKILMGQPTDAYVHYCMKFINMLLSHQIKPILVFDGRHLPAKAQTEAKRRENRQTNRRRAAELLQMGQVKEGKDLLRRSIDVTHKMALELIKHCQNLNIDCIVAPYEADAELAYLNISGIADVVITEDSDLLLFGCKKVFFKIDFNGNGVLIEQDRLYLAMGVSPEHFDIEKFRHMCILSGCDYLASLPGIGLQKARKFIIKSTDCDIHRAITRLGSYLNMRTLTVTKEYRDAFIQALITFKHQLVYCPLKRKQVRLQTPPPNVTKDQLYYAGEEVDSDLAFQLALGNCDPFSFEKLHDFDPDRKQNHKTKTNSWSSKIADHMSIWTKGYENQEQACDKPKRHSVDSSKIRSRELGAYVMTPKQHKMQFRRCNTLQEKSNANAGLEELNDIDVLKTYEINCTTPKKDSKKKNATDNETEEPCNADEQTSPVLNGRSNPFLKHNISPKLLQRRKRLKLKCSSRFRKTVVDENIVTTSKFFQDSNGENDDDSNVPPQETNEQISLNESKTENNIIQIDNVKSSSLDTPQKEINTNITLQEREVENKIRNGNVRRYTLPDIKNSNLLNKEHMNLNNVNTEHININTLHMENPSNKSPDQITIENHMDEKSSDKNEEALVQECIEYKLENITLNSSLNSEYNSISLNTEMDQLNSAMCLSDDLKLLDKRIDSDFLISQDSVDSLKNNTLTRFDINLQEKIYAEITNRKRKVPNKAADKTPSKIRRRDKQSTISKQQSLLSMYGFQKS